MASKETVGLKLFAAAILIFFFALSPVYAVEIPPTPSAHYYGDADGNVSLNLADIAQHNAYSSFKPCSYDTLQPQTSGQYWNTCDVDGNRSCNLSDIAILNSFMSFQPASLGGDPWVLENVNLPLAGNASNTWIPFSINLYMTYSGAPSGRPGISVIAEIDPTSPGHGQLSGRSCIPVAGTRDQLAEPGAQCALAVTITDWQPGHEGEGLTESGTYGFQVWGDGDGDLKIDFHIEEWPAMDIPSVTLSQTVSFTPGITIWHVDDTATGANNGTSWTDAFTTVQTGVDAASADEQVWVAEGTYSTGTATSVLTMKAGVDVYGGFVGTETRLSQRGYPTDHPTVLDGLNVTSQVVMGSSDSALDGFIVQNGVLNGMVNNNATGLEIRYCSFANNTRGMYNFNSGIAIKNCMFYGSNNAGNGGAVYNNTCTMDLANCIFRSNTASIGGGLFNLNSSLTIANCTFTSNTASWGGAIYNNDSSPAITNCILWGDTATNGPELQNDGISSPVVAYSDIAGGYPGTGNINADPLFVGYPDLHLQSASPCADSGTSTGAPAYDLEGTLRPSGLDYDMGAYEYWWGPQCSDGFDNDGDTLTDWPSDPGCSNASDISENGTDICDDGIDNDGDTLTDWPSDPGCIDLADDSERLGTPCDDGIDNDGDTLTDWIADPGCQGDCAGLSEEGGCQDGIDNDGDTLTDFPSDPGCASVSDESEFGTNACDDGIDNDGDTLIDWPHDPECASLTDINETNICYVDSTASGANNGTSWADAFSVVQDGIDSSFAGDMVWVAQGTYYRPISGTVPVMTMKNGVETYGGFVGTESSLSERGDPSLFPTVLDGQAASAHVVIGASDSVLDGFIIQNGDAAGGNGAGMYNDSVNGLIVQNCTIENNTANEKIMGCCTEDDYDYVGSGAGMYNFNSEVTVSNCNINGNSAAYYGGGIYNDQSNVNIDRCVIDGNTAFGYISQFSGSGPTHYETYRYDHGLGGGIYNNNSSAVVATSLVSGNNSWEGAGIYSANMNSFGVINSTISMNEASGDSYYMCYTVTPPITDADCLPDWQDNSRSGGMYVYTVNDVSVTNTIIYSNTAFDYPNLYIFNSSSTVSYSDIGGGYAGTGNIDADPMFVSSSDFHLQYGSPCENTGTSIRMPLYDLDGNPRPMGGLHEMGAYELAGIYACEDGADNDGDTLIDFPSDPGCSASTDTSEYSSAECDDGIDNDGDSYIDTLDPGCSALDDTDENGANECDDGIDNDADTLVDWPADTGCTDILDNDEYPGEDCYDGVDNDGDTLTDWPNDPGCDDIADDSEYLGTPCDDGVDNDGNTLIDWPADPGCTDMYDNSEGPCVLDLQCSDTPETDLIICPIIYSGCTDTLAIEASNTCTGASVTDNGDGTGAYNAPAQGEAAGPGSCTAAVELPADSLTDYDNINILEYNNNPDFWYYPFNLYVYSEQNYNSELGNATDVDLPNAASGDPGYLTCSLFENYCPFAIDVTGQGAGSVECWVSFTVPIGPGNCSFSFGVCDGYGACESHHYTVYGS